MNRAEYEKLLDAIDRAEAIEGIKRGLEDVKHGRTIPATELFDAMRKRYNIPTDKKASPESRE